MPKPYARIALPLIGMLLAISAASAETLTRISYGKVRFGETVTQAETRLQQQAIPLKGEAACRYVKFDQYPGILFMVEQDIVTRAESRKWIRNSVGVKAGDTLASIKRQHPDIVVTPHKYDRKGNYLTYSTSDGKKAMVFEASKGRVKKIRAGVVPSVSYVEGCS